MTKPHARSYEKKKLGAASKPKPQSAEVYAALDLGTNNCRLLIASTSQKGASGTYELKIMDSFSRIVRLGDSISKTGRLSGEAIERTIDALSVCKKKMQKYKLTSCRLVATEACRRAVNTLDFIKRVKKELGLNIEVINNEEEAKLAVIGCSSLIRQNADKAIVFDIGGGSTEVIWIDAKALEQKRQNKALNYSNLEGVIIDWISIDSGVMNLTEQFGGTSFVDVTYKDMVRYIHDKLLLFSEKNKIIDAVKKESVQMLSTSGTLTTLAALEMGLPKYDRNKVDGVTMEISEIKHTIEAIKKMRPSERFNNGCIGPERADFILTGCAVFEAISKLWPVGSITIADRGVREGIIISLMLKP